MKEQKFNVNCGFFDSIGDDRLYSADDMNNPYIKLLREGVYATPDGTPSTELQVLTASNGMNVLVKSGQGFLGGKWFKNPSDIVITVTSNNDIVPRLDSILMQVDKTQNGRTGNIVYREGTPNSDPQPPEINTNENIIEMRLANIYVAPTVATIDQDVIIDLRGSNECPWIAALIQQPDTSTLYAKWQTAYQKYYDDETRAFNEFMRGLTEELTININVVKYESHYVSELDNTTQIPINIPTFNKDKDVLMVRINHLFATEKVDYTVDSNEYITLNKAIKANQQVDFLSLQSLVIGNNETVLMELQKLTEEVSELKKKVEELSK